MLNLGTEEMAKYPFLAEAGQYLKDKGFTLDQFGNDPDLEPIIEKARKRIVTAAKHEKSHYDITSLDLDLEVFSFLLAIILLKLSGMHTLIRRFSLAEAIRAEKFLEKDLKDISNKTKDDLAIKLIKDLFSVEVQKKNDYFVIPVSDYLTHSVFFHEKEWKLINRQIEKGKVVLTPHQAVRLIRKEIDKYIRTKIQSTQTPTMIDSLEKPVQWLVSFAKQFSVPKMEVTEYPPCIKHAIDFLDKGENLSHSGRFLLATYLLGIGQKVEQIAPLFKNAPDYSEKVTLYQLNHLSGNTKNVDGYKCPSCEKIQRNKLCFVTSDCDGIINPLQFKKKKTVNA